MLRRNVPLTVVSVERLDLNAPTFAAASMEGMNCVNSVEDDNDRPDDDGDEDDEDDAEEC